jgi:hypothetical protein
MSYSHRKEFADETRVSRAAKSITMLIAKKHVR